MGLGAAALLGLVQGLTEFLPVSSTAHLLLVGQALGQDLADARFRAFVAIIQVGTTLAVIGYFRAELGRMVAAAARGLAAGRPFAEADARLLALVLVGTLPAGIAGLLLEDAVESLGNGVIAGSLVGLALVLLVAERAARHVRTVADVRLRDALLIGCAQAVALVPGASRSGCTLTGALLLGFRRDDAARLSFLLSVPIILAAGAYKTARVLPALRGAPDWAAATLLAAAVSAVTGYAAIAGLLSWLRTRTTLVFVLWRLAAGGLVGAMILLGRLPA